MIQRRIEPQSGAAFALRCGQPLRIIDPLDGEVADLMTFGDSDRRRLRAQMDLVVGPTAWSAEISNNYRFTPIDDDIHD
jgi:uncharacterized protein YcgI (DUF1989 family)